MRMATFAALMALMVFGCQTMDPNQTAKSEAAKAAVGKALDVLSAAQKKLAEMEAEYKVIKGMIDAGKSVPAALVERYAELKTLLVGAYQDVVKAKADYDVAKKAWDEAEAVGVAWYNRIPWGTVGTTLGGILLGIAGVYFPALRPVTTAAQAAIQGVSKAYAADPKCGQAVKDSILAEARSLGVEVNLDALVQKYDPPKKEC